MTFTPITLTYYGQFKHKPDAEKHECLDHKIFFDNIWEMKLAERQKALNEAHAQIEASKKRYDELQKKLDELEVVKTEAFE